MYYLLMFFSRKVTLSNLELSVFKYAVSLLSMAIGVYFACYLRQFLVPMVVVGVALTGWATFAWWRGMNDDQY
ncbi:hypothetical protein BH11CYA1_BH11CYA1_14140 [soil metagenome]